MLVIWYKISLKISPYGLQSPTVYKASKQWDRPASSTANRYFEIKRCWSNTNSQESVISCSNNSALCRMLLSYPTFCFCGFFTKSNVKKTILSVLIYTSASVTFPAYLPFVYKNIFTLTVLVSFCLWVLDFMNLSVLRNWQLGLAVLLLN